MLKCSNLVPAKPTIVYSPCNLKALANMRAVNPSTLEIICAIVGDSGWSLFIRHVSAVKMNLYAKVCLFCTYKLLTNKC